MDHQDYNAGATASVAATDIFAFKAEDSSVLHVVAANGTSRTGWQITFAGPSHPKTLAWNEAAARKNLRRQAQIEQAQVNGKKYKVDEQEPDEIKRNNVAWIVSRILAWTPVRLGSGEAVSFSEGAATEILMNPDLNWVYLQAIEFLSEQSSFTKRSVETSDATQSDTSNS